MAGERKQAVIHYRKFNREAGVTYPVGTLENLIRTAMNHSVAGRTLKSKFSLRVRPIGDDNYFINTYSESSADGTSLVFGDVIHFTKGHLQALFQTGQDDVAAAPVQQMPAPARAEYVHSQMFWMVKDDHVFVLQSISLRTEDWENYLAWLLGATTGQLTAGQPIVLSAKFDEEMVGDGDLDNIQEIIIGGIATKPPVEEENDTVTTVREVTQTSGVEAGRDTGWAEAWEILKTLVGGDANVDRIMRAVPEDADLHVQVHIGYKTKKKQVSRVALKQLETGLRNVPDSQLQIKAKGMSRQSDGKIRLHHKAGIKLIKVTGDTERVGSLLDPADVLRAMYEAFSTFVQNGKIEITPN